MDKSSQRVIIMAHSVLRWVRPWLFLPAAIMAPSGTVEASMHRGSFLARISWISLSLVSSIWCLQLQGLDIKFWWATGSSENSLCSFGGLWGLTDQQLVRRCALPVFLLDNLWFLGLELTSVLDNFISTFVISLSIYLFIHEAYEIVSFHMNISDIPSISYPLHIPFFVILCPHWTYALIVLFLFFLVNFVK